MTSPFANLNFRHHGTGAAAAGGPATRGSTGRLAQLFAPGSSTWASADLRAYQAHYPGQPQSPHARKNLDFYLGNISCAPRPCGRIDAVHAAWFGDYDLLEAHHGYIQWLFPIRESGLNSYAQVLMLHEAEVLRKDPRARARLLTSYKLMLDFYGMQLLEETTGELARNPKNYRQRYAHLNRSMHNYLRITRILKCLGELGREELKLGFLLHIVRELTIGELRGQSVGKSAVNYWFPTLRNPADRARLQGVLDELKAAEAAGAADVVLSEERIRQVLAEAKAERLGAAQATAAENMEQKAQDDDDDDAAAVAAGPSASPEPEEDGRDWGSDAEGSVDSPRAEAEAMAPSRDGSAASAPSNDTAQAAGAVPASSASAAAAAASSSPTRPAAAAPASPSVDTVVMSPASGGSGSGSVSISTPKRKAADSDEDEERMGGGEEETKAPPRAKKAPSPANAHAKKVD